MHELCLKGSTIITNFCYCEINISKNKFLVCWKRDEDKFYVVSRTSIPWGYHKLTSEKSTGIGLLSCRTLYSAKFWVWCSRDTNSPTPWTTNGIHGQIKWVVVWLWGISSPSTTLSSCYCRLFHVKLTTSNICWPSLHSTQHIQGLRTSISSSPKWRLLVSIYGP